MPRSPRPPPLLVAATLTVWACGEGPDAGRAVITFPTSAVGAEGEILGLQLARFEEAHPHIEVRRLAAPDSGDERHQLFVQWLSAGVGDPDVLQLDVVWTPEMAAAGWLLPLEGLDEEDLFPAVLEASRWEGRRWAAPWFVDVGMLYYRRDLFSKAPETFAELEARTAELLERGEARAGLVWQGARYEGLVTVFLEYLGAHGGAILDHAGRVQVDSEAGVAALEMMRRHLETGLVPRAALTWQEEPVRFAFQSGEAALMRNWPYAHRLLEDPERSRVAGRFGVAPMPRAPGGASTAALGGSQLAINAFTEHPEAARALIDFLTAPEQMRERAAVTGQLPPRPSLYEAGALDAAGTVPPAEARAIIERARPRPVTPIYTELSQELQAHLHRALSGQAEPRAALEAAARGMRARLDRFEASRAGQLEAAPGRSLVLGLALLLALFAAAAAALAIRRTDGEGRLGLALLAPAVGTVALVAIFPLAFTFWESLHAHDLRAPWSGRPFVGLANYAEAAGDRRLHEALLHTAFFAAASVTLELLFGLALALLLDRTFRGRGVARAVMLLPWAIPAVVAALVWRFMFEGSAGVVNAALVRLGILEAAHVWLGDPVAAWVPLILADVWKTTPFVTLLLLAGLQTISDELLEAARVDGAGPVRRFFHVVLPLLAPTIGVVLLFRTLDAFRVFDLVFVLTGGGPGTATEPLALYTFQVLLGHLRFGYGSALSVIIFALTFALALLYLRLVRRGALGAEP